ncbi:MAG: murein tripeptide amidase MpaA [Euzebyales bacterium]|nr:murein tripeptide amidase MpaA [Euzebyales bacterium]
MTSGQHEHDTVPRAERGVLRTTPDTYGTSRNGLPLQVHLPPDGAAIRHVVFCAIHGTEPDSTVIVSSALRSILPGQLRCAVVLAANPDGVLMGTRGNAAGVELNRNWPTSDWSAEQPPHRWTLEDPQDVRLSSGPEPGSEPEVGALRDLIERLDAPSIVSVHSPLACVDDPGDSKLGRWFSERTGLERMADVGYPTLGSFGTWARERGRPSITYELPRESINEMVGTHSPVFAALLRGEAPID